MKKSLISIIVPVYNSKAHLECCVTSILNQSYKQFELLLIDDGSTDGSSELCDELLQKSEKIRVIHKENGGVSTARNRGLEEARGDYIIFIDSDDMISEKYVEAFMNVSQDADLIIGSIEDVYTDERGSIYKKELRKHKAPLQGNLSEQYYNLIDWLRGPVAKLYRKDIIDEHHLRFDENLSVAEDQVFNFSYYRYVISYKIEEEGLYQYFHYNTKISLSNLYTEKTFSDDLLKMNIEYEFLRAYCPNNYNTIYTHQVIGLLNKYTKLEDDSSVISYYKRIKRITQLHPLVIDKSLGLKKQLIIYLLLMKLYWIVIIYYRYKYRHN